MAPADPANLRSDARTALGVLGRFLILGCIGFGGPTAHIALFERQLVVRRRWLDPTAFASLLALSIALPGPSSSQLAFALGHQRAGMLGALAAAVGFTLPSMLLMTGAVVGLSFAADARSAGWMLGLHAAAAGVVMLAVIAMARSHLVGPGRAAIAAGATIAALGCHAPWLPIATIVLAACLGQLLSPDAHPHDEAPSLRLPSRAATVMAGVLLVALIAGSFVLSILPDRGARLVAALIQAGSLVIGGGHVVLPLLERSVVDAGLLDQSLFAGGYALTQAVPGPLFSIASFLGATHGLPGGTASLLVWSIVCTTALMLPGMLMLLLAMRGWHGLAAWSGTSRALSGVAAAVTGLLAAAWIDPIATTLDWRSSVTVPGILIIVASVRLRLPIPLAIVGCAAWGWLMAS
ncbi:MAG: chromate efflux transporter [Planctomycetes bacterium]|nr:chromate efflux transporter [Planctomycetota bacterium]